MDLLGKRIIASIVLFCATFVVGVLPVTLIKYWKQRQHCKKAYIAGKKAFIAGKKKESIINSNDSHPLLLQMMMQFGGGVLLCTIFVDLLPEVKNDYNNYQLNNGTFFGQNLVKHNNYDETGKNHIHEIPYIELIICIGFFTVYFFECLMNALIDYHQQKHKDQNDLKLKSEKFQEHNKFELDQLISPSTYNRVNSEDNGGRTLASTTFINKHQSNLLEITDSSKQKFIYHFENYSNVQLFFVSLMKGLVIIIAFSVHSIFDGLVIGLQSTRSRIWTMLFAISTHKLVIAFVISVELYQQSKRISIVIINMALFSMMSPIGIVIIILAESSIKDSFKSSPSIIILNALAIGTILYIVFFEILQKINVNLTGLIQFASMIFGFIVMLVITLLIS